MRKIYLQIIIFIFIVFNNQSIFAQNYVSVNPASVLNDVSSKPFGINMNTFMDDEANRPSGARPLRTALNDIGAKFLRFPGGEKADLYMWSKPPYDNPATSSLARDNASSDWPARDAGIWDSSTKTWANNNYNFDEFIADCRAVGGEPVIVVAMDGIYKDAFAGSNSLTYAQALEMAWKWVYYANVVKGYNVKYWSIGNETWIDSYAGGNPGFTQYGKDVKAFAQAMKNVDPTIKIGINGGSASDFSLALAQCASDIDFLDVHTYPCYGFTNYSNYETNNISSSGIVNAAQSAIDALPNASDRSRIFIAMTEISSLAFTSGSWDNGNAVNHGLASFDLLAQLANNSRVKFTQYWNTRWVDNNNSQPESEDALDKNNNLNASGKAISLLFKNVHDKMVSTTSTTSVKTFASYNSTTKALTIFLLNKSQSSSATNLILENYNANSAVERWVYKGTGVTDLNPTYTQQSGISTNNNSLSITLDPASITILKLTASTSTYSKVTGTSFGTGSWSACSTCSYDKAFDGNTTTFYDASTANGGYAGMDAGSEKVVTRIRYYPRAGYANRMVGGKFQGSNTSNSSGFVDLYTIPSQPTQAWHQVDISNTTAYRYLRYLSSTGGYANVAEVEFYINASNTPIISCSGTGNIFLERYDGIIGNSINSLTTTSKYPNRPDFISNPTSFEAPSDIADNYGLRMRGYLCPPTTGSYIFWIAGDDNVELWLSTDTSSGNKTRIAYHSGWTASREWNKYSTQKSATVTLQAGTHYYIEALMQEGGGGDNLAVGWAKPGQDPTSPSQVIPGSALLRAPGNTTILNTCGSVINSSFESDLSGWTTGSNVAISTSANTGSKAAVLGTGGGGMEYAPNITAASGNSIAVEVYAKVEGGPSWAGIGIDYLNASNVEVGEQYVQITAASYTKYSFTATAPANTSKIRIWIWKSGSVGKLYIDDVCLRINGAARLRGTELALENEEDAAGLKQELHKINVYPNPASDLVNISFYAEKEQYVRLVLRNALGQEVWTVNKNAEKGLNTITLKLYVLKGLYNLTLHNDGRRVTKLVLVE